MIGTIDKLDSTAAPPWPPGGGEMGARVRAHDWAATPLGPVEGWPESLRTAAAIMLTTRHPANIFWGPELVCLYNDAYAASLGPEQHPVSLGIPAREASPEAYPLIAAELAQVMAGGEPTWAENRPVPVRRRGRVEDVFWTYSRSPIPDFSAPNGVGGVLTLVTETTPAVTARLEGEARLRRVLEIRTVGVLFFTLDSEIIDANETFLSMIGYTREELVSGRLRCADLMPRDWHWRDEQTVAELKEQGESGPFDKECYRKDGSRIWIHCASKMLPDGTGVEFVLDVTEQKRAQEATRESEERFRQFAEASSDGVWIRDVRTLEMEYVNPAFETIYGTDRAAVLDDPSPEHWAELIHPEDRAAALGAIGRVAEGEARTHEFRIVRPADGRVRWIQNTDFPLRNVHGRLRRFGGFAKDVTEAKELSDRLTVLVAELQHRTRNLIAVVRSVADRTLADSASLDVFQERFRRRLDALARVNGLLSRLNGGDRIAFDELVRAELAAHGAVDEAGHDPQVALEGPRGVPLRSATVQTFALALHELATNALKHGALSRPEGRLQVRWAVVSGQDGEPRLRVEWIESGMPVSLLGDGQPLRNGYGRELIESALPYQLKAQTSYEIGPDGVRCTITLPVSARYAGTG